MLWRSSEPSVLRPRRVAAIGNHKKLDGDPKKKGRPTTWSECPSSQSHTGFSVMGVNEFH